MRDLSMVNDLDDTWRSTSQRLAPASTAPTPEGQYDIYPAFPLEDDLIKRGVDALASQLEGHRRVVLDGYVGVFWEDLRERLDGALRERGRAAVWHNVADAFLGEAAVDALIEPFLGGDDPLFGTRFNGSLAEFFDAEALSAIRPSTDGEMDVLYGVGAALVGWKDAALVYVDVPKNEIQFRSRAGTVCNVGAREPRPPKSAYKRFYFVDWPALDEHRAGILPEVDCVVDAQRPDDVTCMRGDDLRRALTAMSRSSFRVRPWFEPGAWGGHWMERHIPQLPQDVPNYAWSFELIAPENGIVFDSGGTRLEVSFDFLMAHAPEAVLGDSAALFGRAFPIRFDFLDTVEGGNLSLQCHPRPDFIQQHFGERFTQDETYYIFDCTDGAEVYLGFRDDVDPDAFRDALEQSAEEGVEIDMRRFVQIHPASRHDLFLIPSGTVHCSGAGNLVLEISATPYIFTFKMYDWMRLDLDGKPRPLNVERAFQNLQFDRKGASVADELIASPTVIDEGPDWQVVHLPTHGEHFYDVHRLDFETRVEVETGGSAHVLNLVEGSSIILETEHGPRRRFNYAETFAVPASAGRYRLINHGERPANVVKAFVKPGVTASSPYWRSRIAAD